MQELPLQITRDKVKTTQVFRSKSWAVYKLPYHAPCFDVFRIRIHQPKTFNGHSYPLREAYPPASQWGTDAFSVTSIDLAMKIVRENEERGTQERPRG